MFALFRDHPGRRRGAASADLISSGMEARPRASAITTSAYPPSTVIPGTAMEVRTIGIDLAKNVFAVCGADSSGRVLMRRQLRRAQVLSFTTARTPIEVSR